MAAKTSKPKPEDSRVYEAAPDPFGFSPFTLETLSHWNGVAPFATQSARFGLAGLAAAEAALNAWRRMFDVTCATVRRQQDMMLASMREQLAHAADEASSSAGATPDAQTLFAPMLAATRACETMSDAMLSAQRDALELFSQQTRPH